jgi:hypothetical protein
VEDYNDLSRLMLETEAEEQLILQQQQQQQLLLQQQHAQQDWGVRGFLDMLQSNSMHYLGAIRGPARKPTVSPTDHSTLPAEQVWTKLKYSPAQRSEASERCQMWITWVVLKPLVQEIDNVNKISES